MEEEKLIKDAQEGKTEAFGELYDKYLPKIYRFIFFKINQRAEAEDITHQVFLSAWQNIRSYKTKGFPFSSWLYRIARNAVIDHYRTKKDYIDIESIPHEIVAEPAGLAEMLDTANEIEFVMTALQTLKEDEQNMIIMKFVNDLSNKEIAEALEKSEGAIRVLQHRALKQLKNILKENERHYPNIKEV